MNRVQSDVGTAKQTTQAESKRDELSACELAREGEHGTSGNGEDADNQEFSTEELIHARPSCSSE